MSAAAALRGARVLVTGATGFAGGVIARRGIAAGLEVHCLGRREPPAGAVDHRADLADRAATAAAVREAAPDIVLNLASPGVSFGTADFAEMVATLATGTEALLQACAELPSPPVVIHVGTGYEYKVCDRPVREDDPLVPSATRYGAAKAASSAVVGGFAGLMPISLLRPFNLYGKSDRGQRLAQLIVKRALAGEQIAVSPGEQVRDFLHIDDFAELVWTLAADPLPDNGFEILNAGSGEPVTLRRFISAIAAALGQEGIDADLAFGGVPYRPGEPMLCVPDLTRLSARTAWTARTPLDSGMAEFVCWSLAECR